MAQFVKIPKKMILKHDGNTLKVYGAIVSHLRNNKVKCFPTYERLTKLTGITNRNTISKAIKELKESVWINTSTVKNNLNMYEILQPNSKFKPIPISALTLSRSAFKLYCTMKLLFTKGNIDVSPKYIQKKSNIPDYRTFKKALLELKDTKFVCTNITEDVKLDKKRLILYRNFDTSPSFLPVNLIHLTGKFDTPHQEICYTSPGNLILEVDYIEIDYYRIDYVQQSKTKNGISLAQFFKPSSAEKFTETNLTDKKESFAAEPDSVNKQDLEEMDQMEAWGNMPEQINRKQLRNMNRVHLSKIDFAKFMEHKNKGFNGDATLVSEYVNHEMKLWKGNKLDENSLRLKFQKEAYTDHPVFKHFKEMDDFQRSMELNALEL